MNQHEISEYIENLPLQKSLCNGYRPDDVYEVICNLSSMYNQILSESYDENEELKRKIEHLEKGNKWEPAFAEQDTDVFSSFTTSFELKGEQKEEEPVEEMSDKELQRLKRGELLEILLEQSRENETLRRELTEKDKAIQSLNTKLESRKIAIKEAGTIAEASFKLNGVFDAAEKAAQQYLDNLQSLYQEEKEVYSKREQEVEDKCAAMLQATEERCNYMKEETTRQCEAMESDVKKKCEDLHFTTEAKCKAKEQEIEAKCLAREREAEEKCRALDQKAKEEVDKRWEELSKRLEAFYAAHEGLRELLNASKMI